LLESLGLREAAAPVAGMPAELVAAIEKYPLELRHMKAELRQYQVFGAKYALSQAKALLGDEMGLGKTIQALAMFADLKAKNETHFLVVCPASVLVNWKRETEKHTDLPAIIIHGSDKQDEFLQWKREGGVGVTNFETIKKLTCLLTFNYGALVVDEAHFVKNPEAQRTKALLEASQRTWRVLYMTGTPLENRVDEMCFLVNCLRPDIAETISTMKSLSATAKFREELASVYLRRVRSDVLTELPDLIESEDWLELSSAEFQAYREAVLTGNFMAMRRVSWDVETSASSKAQRLVEICDEARDEGRRAIVFSFFLDTLGSVCQALGSRAVGPITGAVSTAARQQMIDSFSESAAGTVLVAQVQAGGVGLNIQSASVVIFTEPQIKPSLETQAISRAYRMGQVHDVQVHRLLAENTIDERMMDILSKKQFEFDTYAEESVAGIESQKSQTESAWIKAMIEEEQRRLAGILA
jgi:SNF2 family DNA or RNA helicase